MQAVSSQHTLVSIHNEHHSVNNMGVLDSQQVNTHLSTLTVKILDKQQEGISQQSTHTCQHSKWTLFTDTEQSTVHKLSTVITNTVQWPPWGYWTVNSEHTFVNTHSENAPLHFWTDRKFVCDWQEVFSSFFWSTGFFGFFNIFFLTVLCFCFELTEFNFKKLTDRKLDREFGHLDDLESQ